MSSNLKVNTILPSTGSNVAIGTAGGTVTIVGNVDIDINSGISTFNDIHISDKIVHDGDTNTSLRFPAADTITAETAGSERLRIDSSGRLGVGVNSFHDTSTRLQLQSPGSDHTGIVITAAATSTLSYIYFGDTADKDIGRLVYENSSDSMQFWTNNAERLRITSDGNVLLSKTSTSDYGRFEVKGPTADNIDTTSDIRTKTVATFSGSTPGTTAAGKGMGIVIKPIADRGSHYFFGAANDSANQEAHGRFIIKSGHLASASVERLRIAADGKVELTETLLPRVDNTPSIGNGTKNFNSIWASTRFRGNDNVKLILGNSQDLVIRHDGTDNLIESPQGHNLYIKSGTDQINQKYFWNANLKQIQCNHGGSVLLYYNDGERVKTTSDGLDLGGEVNFTSGNNVRTFAGTSYLADGAYVDIVQSLSGYAWGMFEFYCISYHGSIGRAYWKGSMARYSGDDNYTLSNNMGYCNLERSGSTSSNNHPIRIQRTGTYGTVQYNYYIRCYAPNSVTNWAAVTNATKKYDGN